MKVSYCEKCKCYERRTYSTYHTPNHYHPIGMNHAYGFCRFYGKRCSEIKPRVCKGRILEGLVKQDD